MKYGYIESMRTHDVGSSRVRVVVDFIVNRSEAYDFMDCLMPAGPDAKREPIEAILEHSWGKAAKQ